MAAVVAVAAAPAVAEEARPAPADQGRFPFVSGRLVRQYALVRRAVDAGQPASIYQNYPTVVSELHIDRRPAPSLSLSSPPPSAPSPPSLSLPTYSSPLSLCLPSPSFYPYHFILLSLSLSTCLSFPSVCSSDSHAKLLRPSPLPADCPDRL